MTSSAPTLRHVTDDLASDLARYLRHLPRGSQREEILGKLALLPEPERTEVIDCLRRLNRSPLTDPRFRETYLFAPRRWPGRTVLSAARSWADPALRHLLPVGDDPGATLLFRETGGVSDMWLLRLEAGFYGELQTRNATVAVAHLSGGPAVFDGGSLGGSGAGLLIEARQQEILTSSAEGTDILLVASPALGEIGGNRPKLFAENR